MPNFNDNKKSIRDLLCEAMGAYGCLDKQKTLHTEIGDFTIYQSSNEADEVNMENNENIHKQIFGAISDMARNYFDMRKDNTIGADDYFHCKANYEAASRGPYGELTAKIVGDNKEAFDYIINRLYKGLDFSDAWSDYWHDKDVNKQGRQMARNPLYGNARDACDYQRVEGINEKY